MSEKELSNQDVEPGNGKVGLRVGDAGSVQPNYAVSGWGSSFEQDLNAHRRASQDNRLPAGIACIHPISGTQD